MKKQRLSRLASGTLALSLAWLVACAPQPPGSVPSLQTQAAYFSELEAEYGTFSTLALTASYLERKIRTLIANNDGEGMRREIDFARYKHPQLLIDIMLADPSLYTSAAAMPEVIMFRQQNPEFDAYMQQLSGATVTTEPLELSLLYTQGYTFFNSGSAAVAMAEQTGRSAIVFRHINDTGFSVQCYDAQGGADGVAAQVAESGLNFSIAMDADGDFVVVWNSADYAMVSARRYTSNCQSQGETAQVNSITGFHLAPAVAMDTEGNFAVAWPVYIPGTDIGVYVRRFQANGQAVGSETHVASNTSETSADIAMAAGGDFVVTWQAQDNSGSGIFARRYDNSGVAQGSVFQVNTYTNNDQSSPVAGIDTDGNFVIAWQSQGQDGDGWGIYAQRYDKTGAEQGNEFQVNHLTAGNQQRPAIAMVGQGDFVITWLNPAFSFSNIFAQHYNASGEVQTPAFQISGLSGPSVIQWAFNRSVALDAQGRLIVIWQNVTPV